tara:strand:- start:2203 stop:2526 length:324 start_codon:yes stop_codon:yes gene_type:complete
MSEIYHRLVAERMFPKSNINLLEKGNPDIFCDGYEIWIQDNRTGEDEVIRGLPDEVAHRTFQNLCLTMENNGKLSDGRKPTHIYFYGKHHDLCWIEPFKGLNPKYNL